MHYHGITAPFFFPGQSPCLHGTGQSNQHSELDWTSPSWSSRFSTIFEQHYRSPQCAPTLQGNGDTMISAPALATTHSPQPSQSSVNLSASLAKKNSNTKPSSLTCQAFAFSTSSNVVPIPLSRTCPDSTMSCEESNPKKRRRISEQDHVSP